MDESAEMKVAIEATRAAAAILRRRCGEHLPVGTKGDSSLVTSADLEAERAIISRIRKVFPTHQILGEESGHSPGDASHLWIIDPIDGTKHFVRNIPLFSTEIALMCRGRLVLGVSNAPLLKELMYAEERCGAYLNHRPTRVSTVSRLEEAYLSFGNIKHFQTQQRLGGLCRLAQQCRNARGIGDAWSYHLLSQGKIDVMVEAHTTIWDVAAAAVIIREAGGVVTDMQGGPVGVDTCSLVASNGILHENVLELLNDNGL